MKKLFIISAILCVTNLQATNTLTQLVMEPYLRNFVATDLHTSKQEIRTLSDFKQREIAINLLFNNQHSSLNAPTISSVAQPSVFADLTMINQPDNLFNKIDHTQTLFGQIYLLKELSQATADVNVIISKQAIIQKMLNNDNLQATLHNTLEIIKQNEHAFLNLWAEDPSEINNLFFNKKFLITINNNAYATSIVNNLTFLMGWFMAHPREIFMAISENTHPLPDYSLRNVSAKAGSIAQDFVLYNSNPKNLFTGFFNCKKAYDNLDNTIEMTSEQLARGIANDTTRLRRAPTEQEINYFNGIVEGQKKYLKIGSYIGLGMSAGTEAYLLYNKLKFYYGHIH